MESVQTNFNAPLTNRPKILLGNKFLFILLALILLTVLVLSVLFFNKGQSAFSTQVQTNSTLLPEARTEITSHLQRAATASTTLNKFYAYTNAFDQLLGQYSSHPDKKTLATLKELKAFIKANFPKEFKDYQQKGIEHGFDPWEIRER